MTQRELCLCYGCDKPVLLTLNEQFVLRLDQSSAKGGVP